MAPARNPGQLRRIGAGGFVLIADYAPAAPLCCEGPARGPAERICLPRFLLVRLNLIAGSSDRLARWSASAQSLAQVLVELKLPSRR